MMVKARLGLRGVDGFSFGILRREERQAECHPQKTQFTELTAGLAKLSRGFVETSRGSFAIS